MTWDFLTCVFVLLDYELPEGRVLAFLAPVSPVLSSARPRLGAQDVIEMSCQIQFYVQHLQACWLLVVT